MQSVFSILHKHEEQNHKTSATESSYKMSIVMCFNVHQALVELDVVVFGFFFSSFVSSQIASDHKQTREKKKNAFILNTKQITVTKYVSRI